MVSLFVSYARKDRDQVLKLVQLLRDGGYDPWFDHDLVPGQPWGPQLKKAIANSDVFLYALTRNSTTSEWCKWELNQAAKLNKPVMPVLLEKCPMPASLKDIQYVDFSDGIDPTNTMRMARGLQEVAQQLNSDVVRLVEQEAPEKPKGRPASAPITEAEEILRPHEHIIEWLSDKRYLLYLLGAAAVLIGVSILLLQRGIPDTVTPTPIIIPLQAINIRINPACERLSALVDELQMAVKDGAKVVTDKSVIDSEAAWKAGSSNHDMLVIWTSCPNNDIALNIIFPIPRINLLVEPQINFNGSAAQGRALALAASYYVSGDYAQALSEVNTLIDQNSDKDVGEGASYTLVWLSGNINLRAEDWATATQHFEIAQRTAPDLLQRAQLDANLGLAHVENVRGKDNCRAGLVTHYDAAIKLIENTDSQNSAFQRLLALLSTGRGAANYGCPDNDLGPQQIVAEVEADLQKGIDAGLATAFALYGRVLVEMNFEHVTAHEKACTALALNADEPLAYYVMGRINYDYQDLAGSAPSLFETYRQKAQFKWQRREAEVTLQDLQNGNIQTGIYGESPSALWTCPQPAETKLAP